MKILMVVLGLVAAGSGVPKAVAHFMAASQVPIAGASFDAKVTVAGWSEKPSYATVGLTDREIG